MMCAMSDADESDAPIRAPRGGQRACSPTCPARVPSARVRAGRRRARRRTASGGRSATAPAADGRHAPRQADVGGREPPSPARRKRQPAQARGQAAAQARARGASRRRPRQGLRVRQRDATTRLRAAARRRRADGLRGGDRRRARQGRALHRRAPAQGRLLAPAAPPERTVGTLEPLRRKRRVCILRAHAELPRPRSAEAGDPMRIDRSVRWGESAHQGRSAARMAARARQLTP